MWYIRLVQYKTVVLHWYDSQWCLCSCSKTHRKPRPLSLPLPPSWVMKIKFTINKVQVWAAGNQNDHIIILFILLTVDFTFLQKSNKNPRFCDWLCYQAHWYPTAGNITLFIISFLYKVTYWLFESLHKPNLSFS